MSRTQPVIQQYYPIGESQNGQQNNANLAPLHSIRQKGRVLGASAISNRFTPVDREPYEDINDCFRVVRSTKHVSIPCTRNEYRRYKVRVPKQVRAQVPKRVEYTDYETREKKEPYSVKRVETAYREEDEQYTVQVPKKVTKMVKITKRIPKTVYVDVVIEEPRDETIMVSETRNRSVKVPYQKEVLEQKYRTVTEKVPVTKYRTEYHTVSKTVYEDSWKTEVVPVTNIVHREIPVYNIVTNDDCGSCEQIDAYPTNYKQVGSAVGVLPEPTYNDQVKPYVKKYPPYVETQSEPVPISQFLPQNDPKLVMNPLPELSTYNDHVKSHVGTYPLYVERPPESVPTNQVTPQNEAQHLMNAHPEPVLTNQVPPQNEAPHLVNAHSEPGQNNQVAPRNEPQPVMNGKVTKDPDPAPVMKPSPVIGNNESVRKIQSFESTAMKEDTIVQNNTNPASFTNDTAPQDEQKVEKWIETKYAAPEEYDSNKNGVLDSQDLEEARADGNLLIQQISVVENHEEGGTVAENDLSQPPLTEGRRKQKKRGGWKRRKRKKSRR